MKQLTILPAMVLFAGLFTVARADLLTLKSGKSIEGTFLTGSSRHVQFMAHDGKSASYPLFDIKTIAFSAMPPAPEYEPPTASAPKAPAGILIPAGTTIAVRLIDGINVDSAAAGQTFRASVDDPVSLGGRIIIPRGADAIIQAVSVQQSGRMKGSDEITLKLNRVVINGKPYDVATTFAQQKSAGEGKKTGRKLLGGAGLGAIVGGIAGGGTGAAIGAAAGGAGGAALAASGQAHLKVPAESRLEFQLAAAFTVR